MRTHKIEDASNVGASGVTPHAENHTNGTDDIQEATVSQKGLMASAQVTELVSAVQPGDLAVVATTGDHDDLVNKPEIPDELTDLDTTVTGVDLNADHAKLLDVEPEATKNSTDAGLRDRSTHTETQTASTISDFDAEVSSNASVIANTAKVSADGSVETHNDISSAGSGAIITSAERSKLSGLESSKFLGEYTSLSALETAHPSPGVGSYGYVDTGIGQDVVKYIWDTDDSKYVLQLGESTTETPASIKTKYESNSDTNAYTDSEKSKVANQSGVNTGDQDLSGKEDAGVAAGLLADLYEATKEPTGFEHPGSVGMTYDPSSRTVTITSITGSAFYDGEVLPEIVATWESPAHGLLTDTLYHLFYDGTYHWETVRPNFDVCHIAQVFRNGVNLCKRETHGFMQFATHEELHNTLGTYRYKGTGQLADYVLDSTVPAERRPTISEAKVFDEDLPCILPELTSSLYSRLTLSGANTANMTTDEADIIPLSGSQPYYNEFTGGVWVQTLFPINSFGNVFVLAVPTTDDAACQKGRFIFIQPQANYSTALAASGQTPDQVSLGHLGESVEEYVFVARIQVQYAPSDWKITAVDEIAGTRVSQLVSTSADPAGTAAAEVAEHELNGEHDYDHVTMPVDRVVGGATAPLDLAKLMDYQWSAGMFNGGSLSVITDNGDGTVDLTAGAGVLRTSSLETSDLILVSISAESNILLTDNKVNYIYADYNAGSPVHIVTDDIDDFNCKDKCVMYRCSREGVKVKAINLLSNNIDGNRKDRRKDFELEGIRLVPGTAQTADEGSRNISVTEGRAWLVKSDVDSSAFDTSAADDFELYYGSGSTWGATTGNTQVDNLSYNDGTTTPATLGVGRANVSFLYLLLDELGDPTLAVIAGGDHKTPEDAAAESPPAVKPPEIGAVGVYLAKIVVEQNAAEIHSIYLYGTGDEQGSIQAAHNALPGLQGGDSEDRYHLTEVEHTAATRDATAAQNGLATSAQITKLDSVETALSGHTGAANPHSNSAAADDSRFQHLTTGGDVDNTDGHLRLNDSVGGDILCFQQSTAGETGKITVYGYRTGDSQQRVTSFGISADLNDCSVWYGTGKYLIPGSLIIGNSSGNGVNEFSTDGTMAGNSDDAVPTEKAVAAFVNSFRAFAKMVLTSSQSVDVNDTVQFSEDEVSGMTTTGYGINLLAGVKYRIQVFIGIVNAEAGNQRIRYQLYNGTSLILLASQTLSAGSAIANQSASPGIDQYYTPASSETLTVRVTLDEIGTGTLATSSHWGTKFIVEAV